MAKQGLPDTKLIYSNGYIVAKGHNSPTLATSFRRERLGGIGLFTFYSENNASRTNGDSTLMELKAKFLKANLTFVAESWLSAEPKNKSDQQTCLLKSSEKLKYLIYRCRNNMTLREATDAELNEIQKFKDEFEGKHLNFNEQPKL